MVGASSFMNNSEIPVMQVYSQEDFVKGRQESIAKMNK